MIDEQTKCVYAVGSDEDHFIVESIYEDLDEAKAYCDSRRNSTYVWLVMKAPIGGSMIDWETVHTTQRSKPWI